MSPLTAANNQGIPTYATTTILPSFLPIYVYRDKITRRYAIGPHRSSHLCPSIHMHSHKITFIVQTFQSLRHCPSCLCICFDSYALAHPPLKEGFRITNIRPRHPLKSISVPPPVRANIKIPVTLHKASFKIKKDE